MTLLFLILALVMAYSAFKIAIEILEQRRHLSDKIIQEYLMGQLKGRDLEYERTIRHLGVCKDCQNRLKDFNFGKEIEAHLVE